ncbi:MAG: FtsX-like permease family protein, partial [Clostridium sp.]
MILNKRILRSAKEHKVIYSVITALLALSIMLLVLFRTEMPKIKSEVEDFKINNRVEDVSFQTIQGIKDVEEIKKKFNLELEEFKYKDFKVAGGTVRVYALRENINKHSIIDGNDLESSGDLVLSDAFFKENKYSFGDEITLGKDKFTIKGTSAYPDFMYLVENEATIFTNQKSFAVGIISKEDFERVDNYNSYYGLRFNEGSKEEVKRFINEKYGVLSWVEKENNSKITTVNGEITAFSTLGNVIPPGIILIVSIIISIVIWRQIKSELSSLGTLYALGYKKKKVIRHYLTYPIVLTLIGTTIGAVLGILTFGTIVETFKIEYALPKIIVDLDFKVIALAMLLPFIIIVPINFIIIKKALTHSPVKLMKGSIKEEGPTFLEKKLSLNKLSFKWNMRIKDFLRSPGRVILTLASIVFSTMLLGFVFVITDAMDDMIKNGFEDAYRGEHMYYLSTISLEEVNG